MAVTVTGSSYALDWRNVLLGGHVIPEVRQGFSETGTTDRRSRGVSSATEEG